MDIIQAIIDHIKTKGDRPTHTTAIWLHRNHLFLRNSSGQEHTILYSDPNFYTKLDTAIGNSRVYWDDVRALETDPYACSIPKDQDNYWGVLLHTNHIQITIVSHHEDKPENTKHTIQYSDPDLYNKITNALCNSDK